MSIGVIELVLLAICGVVLIVGAVAATIYFTQRDRDN